MAKNHNQFSSPPGVCLALFIALLPLAMQADSSNMDRLDAIRAWAKDAPTLETASGLAAPKYQVIRLNIQPLELDGRRYGCVRLKLPADGSYALAVLFADSGSIVESELMTARKGFMPVQGNTRLIHPPISDHEHELEEPDETADLTLPKPWDHLELHLLGYAPELLTEGEE